MSWTQIAVDGQPPSDMSGNVTLYQIYDANAESPTVILTGRFNDTWMYGNTPTHWDQWTPSADPVTSPEIWNAVETEGDPPLASGVVLYEIYDGSSTGLTAWHQGRWIIPSHITVTHWKLPTLSSPP